jgi:hypothetical protein
MGSLETYLMTEAGAQAVAELWRRKPGYRAKVELRYAVVFEGSDVQARREEIRDELQDIATRDYEAGVAARVEAEAAAGAERWQ